MKHANTKKTTYLGAIRLIVRKVTSGEALTEDDMRRGSEALRWMHGLNYTEPQLERVFPMRARLAAAAQAERSYRAQQQAAGTDPALVDAAWALAGAGFHQAKPYPGLETKS